MVIEFWMHLLSVGDFDLRSSVDSEGYLSSVCPDNVQRPNGVMLLDFIHSLRNQTILGD